MGKIYYEVGETMKKVLISIVIIIILGGLGYYFYTMYKNIEIKEYYNAERLGFSTKEEQTVENTTENSKKVVDVIEEVTRKCLWYFKIEISWRFDFIKF